MKQSHKHTKNHSDNQTRTYKKTRFSTIAKSVFWFFVGAILGIFLLSSFVFIGFQKLYVNKVYPGVQINDISFGAKSKEEVQEFFAQKNEKIATATFVFQQADQIASISAKELGVGFDENLLSQQTYSIGKSKDLTSNISIVFQAYMASIILPPAYRYNHNELATLLLPITQNVSLTPVDALFTFENGKVTAFRPSTDGREVNMHALESILSKKIELLMESETAQTIVIPVPVRTLKPKITTDEVNNLGIKELVGTGTSLFQHSIPSRIFNITLAASRMNGILVAPGENFSFDKALGDVSAFTGYKQAYIIQNGRTVLGDGGGVCQVSTTFFRALLYAGLPITERNAHAYRVSYYEEDSPPGIDATIYVPSVDLKFKNDTNNYILIQNTVDPYNLRVTFTLYGAKDGREVTMTKPIVASQIPPPDPLYQDDPTLPRGVVKQVDYAAWGANVSFTRTVKKNGKVIIQDKFISNYRPWQAVYLRGTQ